MLTETRPLPVAAEVCKVEHGNNYTTEFASGAAHGMAGGDEPGIGEQAAQRIADVESGLRVIPVMTEIFAYVKIVSRGASVAVVSHAAVCINHCQGACQGSQCVSAQDGFGGGTGRFR